MNKSQLLTDLAGLLGDSAVIGDEAQMAPYLNEPRKRYHTAALAVARPADVAQVQELCRWANEHRVPLVPQGGNTGLVGAQVPLTGGEVIVSTQRLDKVRNVDAAAGTMVLEAGVILQHAHEVAEAAGAMFPLWIASQGSARIGGVLSSNAGGVQVLAYGNARDLCMGVEAVLADGRLYQGLNALKKDNTGYDLKDLLVGAEGTLGIITAATLKLFPKPEAQETALCSVEGPEKALELFALMRERAGTRLTAFELMPRFGIDLQLKHGMLARVPTASVSPWYALIEVSRPKGGASGTLEAALEQALDGGIVSDASMALSEADRALMWTTREQMSEVQSKEGASIKHDISVPIAAIPQMIAEGTVAAERVLPGIRACPFGHMGDGNLHFNFSQPIKMDGKAFMAQEKVVNAAVYEVVLKLHGSISAEHGIGQLKSDLLRQVKDPVALAMMRSIKVALDPNGILEPRQIAGLSAQNCASLQPRRRLPSRRQRGFCMLLNIGFLDDATRPTVPRLEGLTPAQRYAGEHLREVHDHLRENMEAIRTLIDRARDGLVSREDVARETAELTMVSNFRRFGNLCGQHCQVVNTHHSLEDAYVFPAIANISDGYRAVADRLQAEHVVVHDLLERQIETLNAMVGAPSEERFAEAVEVFEALERVLISHLRYEEEQIGDALGYYGLI